MGALIDPCSSLHPGLADTVPSPECDCNGNAVRDKCDIESNQSQDCNNNTAPDECDIASDPSLDQNGNGTIDACEPVGCPCNADIVPPFGGVTQPDLTDLGAVAACIQGIRTPAECATIGADINCDGTIDFCDLGASLEAFLGNPLACDVPCAACCDALIEGERVVCTDTTERSCNSLGGTYTDDVTTCADAPCDCNGNGISDATDIANGTSVDCDTNDVPDECEGVCCCSGDVVAPFNGLVDFTDIATVITCRTHGSPIGGAECALADINCDGRVDSCDVAIATAQHLGGVEVGCEGLCGGNRYITFPRELPATVGRVTSAGGGPLTVRRVKFVGRCDGGSSDFEYCRGDTDCPGTVGSACRLGGYPGRCVGGLNNGLQCRSDSDCAGSDCSLGGYPYPIQDFRYIGRPVAGCSGGLNGGQFCNLDGIGMCAGGTNAGASCTMGTCAGGDFSGQDCTKSDHSECTGDPDGTCSVSSTCPGGNCVRLCPRSILGCTPGAPEDPEADLGRFGAAPLQCATFEYDWSAHGSVEVFGAEIIPDAAYEIQTADATCDYETNDGCWTTLSPPIGSPIPTARYGDVALLFSGDLPGAPQPDFNDIAAMVEKFLGHPFAPVKAVAQLQPNVPFAIRPIDFKDIATSVEAFLDNPRYANRNHGPCPCPPVVTCGAAACKLDSDCPRLCEDGATSCTSDQDCIDAVLTKCGLAMCVDGTCADECGRCTFCGNGNIDGGEECDGAADAACPGLCNPDCTCP